VVENCHAAHVWLLESTEALPGGSNVIVKTLDGTQILVDFGDCTVDEFYQRCAYGLSLDTSSGLKLIWIGKELHSCRNHHGAMVDLPDNFDEIPENRRPEVFLSNGQRKMRPPVNGSTPMRELNPGVVQGHPPIHAVLRFGSPSPDKR